MRWRDYRQSGNVEDRRGMRVGGRPMALGAGGIVLLLVVSLVTGIDPMQLLEVTQGPQSSVDSGPQDGTMGAPSDELGQFSASVLASTEDVWGEVFQSEGGRYQQPRLVLFSEAVQSACGTASSAVGPFYCPADGRLYLDLTFFDELDSRFGAPGDFAQAYVIAHEVGHHVQNLLGIAEKVDAQRRRLPRDQANELQVRMELQADCFAGVWGHHANRTARLLEPGDVDEGLAAAAAIGDDRLQRQAGGTVQPESWTHGSSAMRSRWLRRGLESGEIRDCDTFAAESL
jgi:predicted metalloprotease